MSGRIDNKAQAGPILAPAYPKNSHSGDPLTLKPIHAATQHDMDVPLARAFRHRKVAASPFARGDRPT